MNYFSLILGIAIFIYGVYTFIMRQKAPEKLKKLEAMKKFYGEKKGLMIHWFFYTILPIVAGIIIVTYAFFEKSN